jgi:tetratricopeptide (TPR) repeat protein
MTKVILNLLQPKLLNVRQGRILASKWGKAVLWTAMFLLCFNSVALAADEKPKPTANEKPKPPTNEKPKPEEPKVNPLEIKTPDPLLPKIPKKGSLTPEQQSQLRSALDQLNTQAAARLQEGKAEDAFDIWYRELRLRRALGPVEEVQALGRVGDIAWQRGQKFDAQVISWRLQEIQKEAQQEAKEKKSINLELLQALGKAYQQVGLPEQATKIYQQILADQRQRGDNASQEETLTTIAQLQMAWLDYSNAAVTYEELLAIAATQGDSVKQFNYLQQLIYAYDKAKQPENALRTKLKLAQTYKPNDPRLPALKIAIASDYEALNKPNEAAQNYQQAYELARLSQQFAYASDALQKLGAVYRSHGQPQFALQVYDILLKIEQQSYNYYGLMNAYDLMGQIHLEQKNYPQALAAYQQGLALAKSLQYQENYFATQIERVSQQSSQR